jgi:exocyst complex component 7
LSQALQNRDLLRSIGEFEEYQPVEARLVRELRGIFECLGGNGFQLTPAPKTEPPGLAHVFGIPANRVIRTEKVGSGCYTNLVQRPLKTGFPHVDSYGESRKTTAFSGIENYYRRTKQERKRNADKFRSAVFDNADAAARDAVRCLEHAMVVVAGEKNVYRTVVSPSLTKIADEDAVNDEISPFYRKACAAAYSHVVACVVDRTMDIIETVFLKEGGIGQTSGSKHDAPTPVTVHSAASAAAAGLRMLDGVRMLVSYKNGVVYMLMSLFSCSNRYLFMLWFETYGLKHTGPLPGQTLRHADRGSTSGSTARSKFKSGIDLVYCHSPNNRQEYGSYSGKLGQGYPG